MTSDVATTEASTRAQPQLVLGQRIETEGYRGTVRFLGPVPGTSGEWIGVEWDDVQRGKHSGENKGVQYFQCLFPGTGSFTRFSNKIHAGQSLLEILKERYVDDEKTAKDLFLGESNIKVDIYDFDRIKERNRKLHLMKVIGLANTNVATAADYDETLAACPDIEDLDLSSSLVSTWQDVANICAPLKKLDILRINRNRFVPLVEPPLLSHSFATVRCLAVNRIYFTWDQFMLLESSFPNLEMLQIGFNMLADLGKNDGSVPVATQKVSGFAKLEDLHLEGNLFSDWNQILRLSHLPRLTSLDLSENKIATIEGPQDASDFKTLKSIRLSDNLVQDWASIDSLGKYNSLTDVWFGNNPILNSESNAQGGGHNESARTTTIARMAHIQHLNGTEVTKKDRFNAELYYLKNVALVTLGMKPEDVKKAHPRFEELCEVHGRPDVSDESRKATSDILKDRLLAITLVSKDNVDGPVKNTVQRNILGTMTVKNLKNLAQKLLKIPSLRQEIVFLTNDLDYVDVKVTVKLADDLREISYYDVTDGVELIVMDKTKMKT
ncbi:tubulin-specific chaperone E [Entomortierella parvispora]|uniref:Tubulin-specific chaperone E n=1 Tax=Entomortierella parvispora TaxID=205924 RepID=A0A9P3H8R7_9FUNG|nr:tubulin-specific chaperone E [Entomortierella parvispora]